MSPQKTTPRIGIIIGFTREGRFGDKPARWIGDIAGRRTDIQFELIDLRDHPLPFFEEQMSPVYAPPQYPVAQRWAARLATLDGFIVVTPEYNHSASAVLKNALDYAYKEFKIVILIAVWLDVRSKQRAAEDRHEALARRSRSCSPGVVSVRSILLDSSRQRCQNPWSDSGGEYHQELFENDCTARIDQSPARSASLPMKSCRIAFRFTA